MDRCPVVELLAISVHEGNLVYRRAVAPVGAGHPDATARVLAGADVLAQPGVVLHSTSWRWDDHDDAVLLTYVVFPAPCTPECVPVLEHIAFGPDATHPSPLQVSTAHVAAHAVRHLTYLAEGRDPHVTACVERHRLAWRVLLHAGAQVHAHEPGQEHSDDAQRRAASG